MNKSVLMSSNNVLNNNRPSRRDDIIQLAYLIIRLTNNFYSLKFIHNTNENLLAFKQKATAEEFCTACHAQFMTDFLQEAYSYKYDQAPDYVKLQFLLKKALLDMNLTPDGRFSWQRGSIRNRPIDINFSQHEELLMNQNEI